MQHVEFWLIPVNYSYRVATDGKRHQ